MPVQHYLENVACKPINDAEFAGTDVRYSAEFEGLEAELAKTGSLHHGEATDWEAVRAGAEAILTTSSKDLRVAAWLAWSLFQAQSFTGLHAGIAVIHALCTEHWAELHPRKSRTRSAALLWLQPRLEQALGECAPQPDDFDALKAIADLLRGLDTHLSAQPGSDRPELLPLCRRLEELIKRSVQQQTPSPVAPPPVKQVTASPSSFDVETPQSNKDAHKLLRQLQDQGRQLCGWWQQQKAGDVRSIKLSRTLLWLPIDSVPEHDANGITALRGLPADRLASYQERLARGSTVNCCWISNPASPELRSGWMANTLRGSACSTSITKQACWSWSPSSARCLLVCLTSTPCASMMVRPLPAAKRLTGSTPAYWLRA